MTQILPMKAKTAIWFGFLFLLVLAGTGAAIWSLLPDFCSSEVIAKAVSPAGKHTAVAYARNCGATTQATINVSLATADANFEGPGNVLIAYGTDLDISWTGTDQSTLLVRFGQMSKAFRQADHYGGVKVQYRSK